MKIFVLALVIFCSFCYNACTGADVEALLASMSLESKIGQMVQIDISYFMVSGTSNVNYTLLNEYIQTYQIGSILNSPFSGGPINGVTGWTADEWRELMQTMQNYAATTDSKIPIIYGIDSIHGATFVNGSALMPQAINLGATFNATVAYQSGRVTSKDTRAAGIPWIFAPVLGLGLQPLWARFPETFGEDPYLAGAMGSAQIKGLQAIVDDGGNPRMAAACMKHYIAYSIPVDGHDRSPVQLPDRILKQLYIPSFQAAVDAGVLTAMESYNEVGGVPMVSSSDYLINLIRKQMNFTGFMVTDYQEIENLHNWHKVSSTQRDAVQLVMDDTTVDMSMVPLDSTFYEYMLSLVQNGEVNISRVDESVRRILNIKNEIGLLDSPAIDLDDPLVPTVGQDSDWDVSLNAARESITLVQNNNNLLPLDPNAVNNIFLTGPTCNSAISQTGGWSIHWQGVFYNWEFARKVTVYDAMQDQFPGDLNYYPGPTYNATNLDGVNMTLALDYAKQADVLVVCFGEGTYAEKPGDINDLALPAGQTEYIAALATTGKPIVLIMIEGRPRLIPGPASVSQSVILGYQPGPLGGQAIVEVLFGTTVPSGRLPFTYPLYQATVMYPYHHKPSDQCVVSTGYHTTSYVICDVQWEFGTGLSYTNFEYSNLQLSATDINQFGEIQVSVNVKNTGNVAAKHSVLLFVYDMYRRVTPEYKLLKRFEKVYLESQQSVTVYFQLTSEDLQYIGVEGFYQLEAGSFYIGISPYVDCRQGDFTIDTQDTTSNGEAMCQQFNLTLASNYSAPCDHGCSMWSDGICGVKVGYSECLQTCHKEQWSFDYVNCILNYYKETCSVNDMQCYDAFGFAIPEIDSDSSSSSGHSDTFVALLTVFLSLFTLLVGFAIGYYFNSYQVEKSGLKQPLLPLASDNESRAPLKEGSDHFM